MSILTKHPFTTSLLLSLFPYSGLVPGIQEGILRARRKKGLIPSQKVNDYHNSVRKGMVEGKALRPLVMGLIGLAKGEKFSMNKILEDSYRGSVESAKAGFAGRHLTEPIASLGIKGHLQKKAAFGLTSHAPRIKGLNGSRLRTIYQFLASHIGKHYIKSNVMDLL